MIYFRRKILTKVLSVSIIITFFSAGIQGALVGHWKMDETAGTSASDSSGNGYTGTLNGNPSWDSSGGRITGALSSDGNGDYVTVSNTTGLNTIKGQMTVALWIYKRADCPDFGRILFRRRGTGDSTLWSLYYGNTSDDLYRLYISTVDGSYGLAVGPASTGDVNTWVHLAGVYDGQGMYLYKNGVWVSSTSFTGEIPDQSQAVYIGASSYATWGIGEYINAKYDEVRIYNSALSQSEIQALMDTTAPGAPATVRDGTGTDISSTTSTMQLSANWDVAVDAQSGIAKYWYAISSITAGGTEITSGWIDNGTISTVTRTGLSLVVNTTYYFSVKADNGVGMQGTATNSNGQVVLIPVDTTAPGAPGAVRDGTGADISSTTSTTQLSANWDAATDDESNIAKYWYAISSTTAGGTEFVGWTDNGLNTSVTKPGLTLIAGTTYYFSVKAQNGAGLQSTATNSNGQVVLQEQQAGGLIGWWKLDETAGTSAGDSSGNSYTGTLNGNPSWDSSGGKLIGALSSDGVGDYVTVSNTTGLNTIKGQMTVALWIYKRADCPDFGRILFRRQGTGDLTLWSLYYGNTANDEYRFYISTASGYYGLVVGPASAGDVNTWVHMAGVYDGQGMYLYKNGVWISSTSFTGEIADQAQPFYIGASSYATWGIGEYVNAKYDEVRVYSRALSQAEIQALIDTTAPGAPGAVRDGTGIDISSITSTVQLSANWDAATDAQSGIAKYWYAIGTTSGGTQTTSGWIANSTNLNVTKTGLSLNVNSTYYFSVKAENGVGLLGNASNSNGQVVLTPPDTTAPSAPAAVRDGTGVDRSTTTSTTQLSANWDASVDNESNIAKYWYAISSTTAGGTEFVGWTDNGINTISTKTGLSLVVGTTYYFSVKAENVIGLQSTATNSNGQTVIQLIDTSSPTAPAQVRDGVGSDINSTVSTTILSANWDASTDNESGIAKYWYAIGTTAGGAEFVGWMDNDTNTTITRTGLSLGIGATYYFSVKAENGAGLQSTAANSDGQFVIAVDVSSPTSPGTVRDGTSASADSSFTNSTTTLSANWDTSVDNESGIANYKYAIGTSLAGTDLVSWADNGTTTTVTKTGLTLIVGTTYYFSVKAENGAGLQSTAANSDGQLVLAVDTTGPIPPATVNDGLGVDVFITTSTTDLSANWDAATDPESGIPDYQYAIGTTAGGTNTSAWASAGNVLTVTKTGLTLTVGTTYYFSIRAVNGQGLTSVAVNSNGQYVEDITIPNPPAIVRDGTGADIVSTVSTTTLSANWDAATDPESGISDYQYAIGTTAGGTNTAGWSSAGAVLTITRTGLSLAKGTTYYFSVRAVNGKGLVSAITNSDGQFIEKIVLVLSNITVADIAQNHAMINWTTDNPGTGQVEYGITQYELLTGVNSALVTSHSVIVTDLVPGTVYHYRVRSIDAYGNETVSADGTFQTIVAVNPGISAYPNPCDFSSGQKMNFVVSGGNGGEVKIFTLDGRLVRKLNASAGNVIEWDGKNSSGENVVSGVYIYISNGASKAKGKIIIIR